MTAAVLAAAGSSLGGCYYMQAVGGQFELMAKREPISAVLSDPALDEETRRKLELVLEARRFAIEELGLPDNDSYMSYADLERSYVVWNVFATPEFSFTPKSWCFPVAGCVAYRGYFNEADARKYAENLDGKGMDVRVGGVPAYSTLGRFADPVLNTMLGWSDANLISTLFHELAHQRLYVKGDTQFNESFASAVAEVGLERWQADRPGTINVPRRDRFEEYRQETVALANAAWRDLEDLYATEMPEKLKRQKKRKRYAELSRDADAIARKYGQARNAWFQGPLNNASLLPLALYRGEVDSFRALMTWCDRNLDCFYTESARLARLDIEDREQVLNRLAADLREGPPPAGGY